MAARKYDIWRFDRAPGQDRLAAGIDDLCIGAGRLRAAGYRRIIVAGHSRGGWIALGVLRQAGLVDAVATFSPAAHGTRPARRAQAMADWQALLDAAAPSGARLALVQFADDPLDPDPPGRLGMVRDMTARTGIVLLSLYQPPEPRGHMGVYQPAFDMQFGARLADFLDPP